MYVSPYGVAPPMPFALPPPPPWVATPDPATGRVYYVNMATRETSWTMPGGPPPGPPPKPKEDLPCATCYACPCECALATAAVDGSDKAQEALKAVQAHLADTRGIASLKNARDPTEANPAYRKSVAGVCVAYNRGHCPKGANCKFAHEITVAAREVALFAEPKTIPKDKINKQRDARSLRPCMNLFSRGRCDAGDACPFSHAPPATLHDRDKMPCFDMRRHGYCRRGQACPYAHSQHPGLPEKAKCSERPCFAMKAKGVCAKGDRCEFSHDPAIIADSLIEDEKHAKKAAALAPAGPSRPGMRDRHALGGPPVARPRVVAADEYDPEDDVIPQREEAPVPQRPRDLVEYDLEEEYEPSAAARSPSPERRRWSPERRRSPSPERRRWSPSPIRRSPSPVRRRSPERRAQRGPARTPTLPGYGGLHSKSLGNH